MAGCPNCEEEGCNEVICTSDITCVDVSFINVPVPADANLSQVLNALEQYISGAVTNIQNVVFNLTTGADCIGLTAGTYSYSQIFQAIIDTICDLVTPADPIETDDIGLSAGISVPSCLTPFSGTDSTDLFNAIMTKLCTLSSHHLYATPSYNYDSSKAESDTPLDAVRDVLEGVADNPGYLFDQTNPTTDPNILSITVQPMKGVVNYWPVKRTQTQVVALTPTKDIYITLSETGVLKPYVQTIGDPAPSIGTELMVYKIVTSATGVVSLTNQFPTTAINPTALSIPSGYITNTMIAVSTIASDRLANAYGGVSNDEGDISVIRVSVNSKGQVTNMSSNLTITGIANGDLLVYDSGIPGFKNQPAPGVGTNGSIPLAAAGTFVASSVSEDVGQVYSVKKVEIKPAGGAAANDAAAVLNINGGPLLMTPVSATTASTYSLTDGYAACVNTTNGTFTSVGFWGVIAGAWVKLG